MSKIPALAFLVVGAVLLFYGFNASGSVASEVSKSITGTPIDKSIWLIALGALSALTGVIGLFIRRSS